MNAPGPTHFCLLTPPGTGAIAVTGVEGPEAEAAILRLFRPAALGQRGSIPIGQTRYGTWHSPSGDPSPAGPVEDLIVGRTAVSVFEIQSHGGTASAARIARDLAAAGLVSVSWQELVRRREAWFIAEPLVVLQQAATLRTAVLLARQTENWRVFAGRCRRMAETQDAGPLAGELETALKFRDFGRRLTVPRRIVLYGPPNAGKSSLLNRLSGFTRSIVHSSAGTTRDVVAQPTAFDGWPVAIFDTAGFRLSTGEIERQGIQRGIEAVRSADLRILVLDASQSACSVETGSLPGLHPDLVVWNKSDLATPRTCGSNQLPVSALTGLGLVELVAAIGLLLSQDLPDPQLAIPLNEPMATCLQQARTLLANRDWDRLGVLFAARPSAGPELSTA